LRKWNQIYAKDDETLAIDSKTMCNATDEQGYKTHVMSAIGHNTIHNNFISDFKLVIK